MVAEGGARWAVCPVQLASSLVGLRPWLGPRVTRTFLTAVSVSCLTLHAAATLYAVTFLQDEDPDWYSSLFYLTLDRCQMISSSVSLCATTVERLAGGDWPGRVLDGLEEAERGLARLGATVVYRRWDSMVRLLLQLAATTVVLVLDVFFYTESYQPQHQPSGIIDNFVMYYPLYVIYVTHAQYYALLNFARTHFDLINKKLLEIGTSPPYQGRIDKVESLLRIHKNLSELCVKINGMYQYHIIMRISYIFTASTFNMYVAVTIAMVNLEERISYIMVVFALFILRCLELWSVISPCEACTKSAGDFTFILYELIISENYREMSTNHKFRTHIAMRQDLEFSAGGLFLLNNELIQSMIGGGTTFLVILLQFDLSSGSTATITPHYNTTNAD